MESAIFEEEPNTLYIRVSVNGEFLDVPARKRPAIKVMQELAASRGLDTLAMTFEDWCSILG